MNKAKGEKRDTASLIPKSGFLILEARTNKIVFSWLSEDYIIAKLNPDGTIGIVNPDLKDKDPR